MYSPLEQFEIIVLKPFLLAGLDLSFTNAALYSTLVFLTLSLLFYLAISRPYLVPFSLAGSSGNVLYIYFRDGRSASRQKSLQIFPFCSLLLFSLF
jgi:hypothetical protein